MNAGDTSCDHRSSFLAGGQTIRILENVFLQGPVQPLSTCLSSGSVIFEERQPFEALRLVTMVSLLVMEMGGK